MSKLLSAPRISYKLCRSFARTSTSHADKENVTQIDLLKRRLEEEQEKRKHRKDYFHEEEIAGELRKWNYRSEFVDRHKMDQDHTRIWASFGLIILVGFGAFVMVKSSVVQSRKEQMAERQRIRKEMVGGPLPIVED
ncbi:unnamed protein product [Bursaphelenchus okinawaensis]|uniref:Uncharacterized protein n=1 Tax=Bursaphelenchus okinawaensis TaxID=465554 RepID=A0A811KV87_9BILA|nr:unnamed protein product [Bursaphelenchus okinawaensis]CAG9111694.1 unnamed protein product [Bursaphelenchus okinawaensis]